MQVRRLDSRRRRSLRYTVDIGREPCVEFSPRSELRIRFVLRGQKGLQCAARFAAARAAAGAAQREVRRRGGQQREGPGGVPARCGLGGGERGEAVPPAPHDLRHFECLDSGEKLTRECQSVLLLKMCCVHSEEPRLLCWRMEWVAQLTHILT